MSVKCIIKRLLLILGRLFLHSYHREITLRYIPYLSDMSEYYLCMQAVKQVVQFDEYESPRDCHLKLSDKTIKVQLRGKIDGWTPVFSEDHVQVKSTVCF